MRVKDGGPRYQRLREPREDYSAWDSGWRYWVAWLAGLAFTGYALSTAALLLEVLLWVL